MRSLEGIFRRVVEDVHQPFARQRSILFTDENQREIDQTTENTSQARRNVVAVTNQIW